MSDTHNEITQKHYQRLAQRYGNSPLMSMKDPYIREVETAFFCKYLQQFCGRRSGMKVLEVGCGNGYLLQQIHKKIPQIVLYGLEVNPELFHLAQNILPSEIYLQLADFRLKKNDEYQIYDAILFERVLINILDDSGREQALLNIHYLLKDQGILLIAESFEESFSNLNQARKENQLAPLKIPKHNRYLNESYLQKLVNLHFKEITPPGVSGQLSNHFFLTRVLHHLLKPSGGKKEQTALLQFWHSQYHPTEINYSPIQFRIFRKRF